MALRAGQAYPLGLQVRPAPVLGASLPGAHSWPRWEMGTSLLEDFIFIFPLPRWISVPLDFKVGAGSPTPTLSAQGR